MATGTLEGTTIAARYKSLLKLSGTANDVLAADASAKIVEDGDGNDSALALSTTRVGVGNSGPLSTLHVDGGVNAVAPSSGTTSNAIARFELTGTDQGLDIGSTTTGTDRMWIQSRGDTTDDLSSVLPLTLNEVGGNVGIGTISPISTLEIQDGLTTTGAVLSLGTKEPSVVSGDVLGRINFYAPLDTGTDSDEIGASILAIAQDTFSDTVNSTALHFQTGKSEAAGTKMVIDENGYVGIAYEQPVFSLHIQGAGNIHNYDNVAYKNAIGIAGRSDDVANAAVLQFGDNFSSDSRQWAISNGWFADGSGFGQQHTGNLYITASGTNNKDPLGSTSPGTTAFTFDEAGYFGIGTVSPATHLQVHGNVHVKTTNADSNEDRFKMIVGGAADDAVFEMYNDSGTKTIEFNAGASSYFHGGRLGIGNNGPSHMLDVTDNHESDILMRLFCDNASTTTHALKIQVKHATPTATNIFTSYFDIDSKIAELRGDASGGVHTSGITAASDNRIKENISNLTGGLDKINALRPVSFNYTDDYLKGKLQSTTGKSFWKDINAGFIAQEFEEHIPVNVRTFNEQITADVEYDNKAYKDGDLIEVKSIDLTRDQVFVSYLVKAIQELSAKVTALESK